MQTEAERLMASSSGEESEVVLSEADGASNKFAM